MNRFHYAETIDELQRRLDNGTADQPDLETARTLSMEPSPGSVAAKSHHPYTSYKDRGQTGSQWSLDRHLENVNRLSAEMEQIAADKQARAEAQKAFHGHVGSGANPPRNPSAQRTRLEKPKPKPIMVDGQNYGPAVDMLTGGAGVKQHPAVHSLSGDGNVGTQRPAHAKKSLADQWGDSADRLIGNWPGQEQGQRGR